MSTIAKLKNLVVDPRKFGGFLFAFVLGVVFNYFMLPQHFVAGTSTYWQTQTEDVTQYIAGFNAFFGEPWRYPLLMIKSLNWPEGTLATFVDIIPLYSAILKLLLPTSWFPFNPFGYWIFLCGCLQAIGGWLVIRETGNARWIPFVGLCVLLLTFPAWINRYGHVSLFSQWIVLFALALILREVRTNTFPALGWGLLLFSALFINIYLFSMAALLFLARWIKLFLSVKRKQAITILFIFLIVGILSVGVTMWPMPTSLGGVEFGFGFYSMNLLAPISGGDLWTIQSNALTAEQQFEGLNYLGAGTLFLILSCIVASVYHRIKNTERARAMHFIWPPSIWLMLLLMAAYSLSNHISFGSHIVYKWSIPDWALPITGQFRASGRFFWPIGYALTIFSIFGIARWYTKRTAIIMIAVACCLQIIDLKSFIQEVRSSFQDPASIVINFKELESYIPSATQTIYVFPKLKCNTHSSFMKVQLPLMLYASQHKMNINTGYIARHTPTCAQEASEIASSDQNKSVYVFVNAEYDDTVILSFFDHSKALRCQKIQSVTLCTLNE